MKKTMMIAAILMCLSGTALGQADIQAEGDIQLVRNPNGLSVSGSVSGLIPGNTYTVWWVILEGPVPLVLNATGGIANGNGELRFGAGLGVGTYVEGDMSPRQVFLGGTLVDPTSATVIIDVLDHGPKIPGRVNEQISTIDAGCEPAPFCPSVSVTAFVP